MPVPVVALIEITQNDQSVSLGTRIHRLLKLVCRTLHSRKILSNRSEHIERPVAHTSQSPQNYPRRQTPGVRHFCTACTTYAINLTRVASWFPSNRETEIPKALPRLLHEPHRPTQGVSGVLSGGVLPWSGLSMVFLIDVASEFWGVGVQAPHPRCSFTS